MAEPTDIQTRTSIAAHAALLAQIDEELVVFVEVVSRAVVETLEHDGKLLIAGNGGSAADAQHMAAEFTGRFSINRPALPALALTTDSSALTAIGNDFGFAEVFARQVEALGRPGDALILISTSGNSENILQAARIAAARGIKVFGLGGRDGGRLRDLVATMFVVPHKDTARIQEVHLLVEHLICETVEQILFYGAGD